MEQNEHYYRKVIGSIGVSLLFFLLFINVFQVVLTVFSFFLPENSVYGEVIYQSAYAIGYLASFMAPVAIMRYLIGRNRYAFRPMYTTVRFPKIALLAIPLGVALVSSAAYINMSIVNIFGFDNIMDLLYESESSLQPYQIVLQFITVCLVPGFCEEFLFRGAILTNCLPFGRTNAILISSLLFALMHQNPQQFFYAFVAGLLLGVLYEKSGSIWPGVLLHTINNFVSVAQGIIASRMSDLIKSSVALTFMELFILFFGIGAAILLLVRFFSQKRDFRGGVFGKSFPAADFYAEVPLSAKQVRTLFWTPSMITFVVICASEAVLLLGMAVLYGMVA